MSSRREKVIVAMSGGVDSSVAACLLVEQGYDVLGLFMRVGSPGRTLSRKPAEDLSWAAVEERSQEAGEEPACKIEAVLSGEVAAESTGRVHRGCCSAADAADARFVAGMLGVPFYALNFEGDFERIIDYFADEYVRGRTPNPCIVCNNQLKFGKMVDYADAVGARFIATGHYARVGERDGRRVLMRGVDPGKDQSYVLFGLDRAVLDRVMFPVGDLAKAEVRAAADRFGLPNRAKPDSVEICFVPDDDYAGLVRRRRPEAFSEGDVLDESERVIGRHKGIGHYTIGQRRGLGIAAGQPVYVTRLDVERNTVTLGPPEALLCRALTADRVKFLVDLSDGDEARETGASGPALPRSFRAEVKIRYLHKAAWGTVQRLGDRKARVVFDEPQRAVTPGQAVVFYDGDVVLGGGWITGADSNERGH